MSGSPLRSLTQFPGAELESDVGVPVTDRADRAVRFHFRPCQLGVEAVELDFFLRGRDAAAGREGLSRHVADIEDLCEPGRVSDREFELQVRTGQAERLERPVRLGRDIAELRIDIELRQLAGVLQAGVDVQRARCDDRQSKVFEHSADDPDARVSG